MNQWSHREWIEAGRNLSEASLSISPNTAPVPSPPLKFAAYLGHLRLGVYDYRNNAGRRLLAVRRRVKGGWRRIHAGLWRNKTQPHLTLRIQVER